MLERQDLEGFVDRYAGAAYRFAYGLAGNEPAARELVQEAFVRAFQRAESFEEGRPLENWFLALLRNLYYDERRRGRLRPLSLDAPVGEGLTVADTLADAREEALLDRLEREEGARRVRAALDGLEPRWRTLLMMIDVDGLSYEQAARALACPLGTVRSGVHRARELLKRRLLAMEGKS